MNEATAPVPSATAREAARAGASPAVVAHGELLRIASRERIEIVDITDELAELVRRLPLGDGLVSLWSLHTTCAVFVGERQPALIADIKRVLEELVAEDADWRHNDPAHSDCDRRNADAHLRTLLLGHSLTLQVAGGALVLGRWQRVLVAELDGPRERSLRVQVFGVA
jgi:secondary thiamine-phosphate synthase enzyme